MGLTWDEINQLGLTWREINELNLTWEKIERLDYSQVLALAQEKFERFKKVPEQKPIPQPIENHVEHIYLTVNILDPEIPQEKRVWSKKLIEIFIEAFVAFLVTQTLTQITPTIIKSLKELILIMEQIIGV